ncbi:AAA family ATPase [Comamonas testosteroni]|uniref:AAA family ATPase n=1 Tax=Comamonas testosteroni TaxID=285 RepID=UPI002DBB8909|nr:AAA family ATPase [Comamonas testosteroni]MEB5967377.1 AAA family ATPase [Comamonas testosteroni]
MTLLKPTLQLRKLQVLREQRVAYHADFHAGVNIIRGQNASGKSTVMDFIFYALGGDSVPWKNEALLCSEVRAELELNGSRMTVSRPVSDAPRNPLSIYWGTLDAASSAPRSEWETYPYQRSASKESFSQVIFRLLEMPELRGEGVSNITLHQLLRLLYVDQRTPHDAIFRAEPFDTILTRETVGNYLCGIYSADLYDAQLELKAADAQLSKSVSELRSLFNILGRSGQGGGSTTDFLQAEAASLSNEIATLNDKVVELRRNARLAADEKEQSAKVVTSLRESLSVTQRKYAEAGDAFQSLSLEVEDSKLFVGELERRLSALEDSEATRKYLGAIKFNFCPCCLAAVEDKAEQNGVPFCQLCKSAATENPGSTQLLRMRNELALQRRESAKLLEDREAKLQELARELPVLARELKLLEGQYRAATQEWTSPVEREIDATNLRLGELKQKLIQIGEYQRLAGVIEDLQNKRAALEARKRELQDKILFLENKDEAVKAGARLSVANELVSLLRADLPRQEEFISATAVDWSFGDNRVIVNGHTQFSESSMVILKHCFHLALLAASTKHDFFRVPRFLLLDGIEDGGQEIERSHHLQELVVKLSESLPADHQIIFSTSQIAPSLQDSDLVVGKASTVDDKTLAIR